MAAAPNPCDSSFVSQIFAGNAVVCSKTFRDYEVKAANDQIQSVVDKTVANYGANSSAAQIAEVTAAQQEAHSAADVASTNDEVAASTVGQIFTTCGSSDAGLAIPGLPCIAFKWIAIGIGGLVVLYFLALVSSLIPRPR